MQLTLGAQDDSIRYRLLELPDASTLESIKAGEDVQVRGGPDDEAILIIGQQSYRIRELCTSNTFLLVNETTGIVQQSTHSVLEVVPIKGLTTRLVQLLRTHPYNSPNDPNFNESLHKDVISGSIQASDDEIEAVLKANRAILIKDHWCIIGAPYLCRFFELFFTTALLEDWPYAMGSLRRNAVIAKFKEDFYDEFGDTSVLNHILDLFADGEENTEIDEWIVSERLVCRFFADQLLRAKTEWASAELLPAWQKLVGEFTPSLSMLRGIALFHHHHSIGEDEFKLTHMCAEELPPVPAERLKLLFQIRQRWFYDDLLPFVEGLEESEKKLQGLMIKFARLSTDQATGRKLVTPLIPI